MANVSINVNDYMVQVGQHLTKTSYDQFGTSVTTVATISCLVFKEEDQLTDGVPIDTKTGMHLAIVPNSLTVAIDDYLVTVIDSFGNTVISNGRVTEVVQYAPWYRGIEFKVLRLDANQTRV